MTLRSSMAADMASLFSETDEFADAATFKPSNQATAFAIVVIAAEPTQEYVELDGGTAKNRKASILGTSAVIRAGIAVIEGAARAARRGDVVVIATGAYAGTWTVETSEEDVGGGTTMACVLETRQSANGREARKV